MPFLGKTPSQIVDPEVDIDGGTIDGVSIGSVTANAGAFTNLTATGTLTLPDDGISGDDVNGGTISNFASTGIDDNATSTAITIDSSQNVGIGVTPAGLFNAGGNLIVDQSGDTVPFVKAFRATTGNNRPIFQTESNIGVTATFAGDGNTGFGIATPQEKLHVYTTADSRVEVESTTGLAAFKATNNQGSYAWYVDSSADKFHLYDFTDASNRLTLDGSGNFGIGTTSPSATLHSAGNIHVGVEDNSNHSSRLKIISGGSAGYEASLDFCYEDKDTVRARINTDGSGGRIEFHTFDGSLAESMRIAANGNVGIGTESPSYKLDVDVGAPASQDQLLGRFSSQAGVRSIAFVWDDSQSTLGIGTQTNHPLAFHINGSSAEKMRLDTSGNLLVGKTALDNSTVGCRFNATGDASFVANGNRALVVVRKSSDGEMALFLKDSTTVGKITTRSGQFALGCNGTGIEFNDSNDAIIPFSPNANNTRDNALDLGMSSVRFDNAYIYAGVIEGSDEREKQQIAELDEAETRVAVACKGLLRKWRWKHAVEAKDNNPDSDEVARIHFGIVAQELKAAFEAEGLDAGRYGMFIHTTWTDEETGEERDRMGIRYSELLAFIIAAI